MANIYKIYNNNNNKMNKIEEKKQHVFHTGLMDNSI